MSMPVIIASTTTRPQAITDMIESVALEQTALSHILNAEGEKLQKVVRLETDTENLRLTNASIQKTINAVTLLEIVLTKKLDLFDGCLCPVPEPCVPVENVEIALIPPDLGRVVTKIDNQNFTISKESVTMLSGQASIIVTPSYPLSLVSAPDGVSLSENILTIDYSVVTEGNIVLATGTGDCEIQINIEFFDING